MFKRLYVDNYKCLVNFDLPMQDLTLLLGRNGTGKTSVLDVAFALRELLSGKAALTDPGIFPSSTLTRWQSRRLQVFEVEAQLTDNPSTPGETLTYRLEIEHAPDRKLAWIHKERLASSDDRLLFRFDDGNVTLFRDDHSEGPTFSANWSESALARVAPRNDNARLTRFLDFMRKVMVCGLYPANFEPEASDDSPILDREARNFSAWFQHIQLEQPGHVAQFIDTLKGVIDHFLEIRLQQVGLNSRALMVKFEENGQRYELRLDELSDGQRALIALYALVRLAAGLGYTLLLDEPENYVALAEIQPWLLELADSCGDTVPQAVLCSHHPELIDLLGGAHGLLMSRESSGVTKLKRVNDISNEQGIKLSEIIARGWEQ